MIRLVTMALCCIIAGTLIVALPPVSATQIYDSDVGLDPGHSRVDVGAAAGGTGEYEITLDVAFRTRALLEAQGIRVRMSRIDHSPLTAMSHPDLTERTRLEQEARIASVGVVRCYVSLHFNGAASGAIGGTETYFNPSNNAYARAERLAASLQRGVLSVLGEAGYQSRDRGVKPDLAAGKPYGHFFSLRGPYPAALVEALFLSNPVEASLIRADSTRQALARGYARGITDYLAGETSVAARSAEEISAFSDGGPEIR